MDNRNLTIHDLPRVERPREKLIQYGPFKLTDSELLAIILRTGRKGENVLAMAKRVLGILKLDSFKELTFNELVRIAGIGQTKACEIIACIELGKRIFKDKKLDISQILSPVDVFNKLKDIRDNFIKYLSLPVLYDFAIKKNMTK